MICGTFTSRNLKRANDFTNIIHYSLLDKYKRKIKRCFCPNYLYNVTICERPNHINDAEIILTINEVDQVILHERKLNRLYNTVDIIEKTDPYLFDKIYSHINSKLLI